MFSSIHTLQVGSGLHTAEIVHWIALGVMAVVYTMRILWLFKFKKGGDRSAPGGQGRTSAKQGAYHSLANVALPMSMESTRKNLFFYTTFVIFHLGVVCGIALAFLSTLWMGFILNGFIALVFRLLMAGAFLVGIYRMFRRLTVPHMKLISTPDDYFSLGMLIVWFGLGALTHNSLVSTAPSEGLMIAYLYLTSFFLLYVPFSKISHYLYYPFTRWWIGKALGHRGSFPIVRGQGG